MNFFSRYISLAFFTLFVSITVLKVLNNKYVFFKTIIIIEFGIYQILYIYFTKFY